MRDADRTWRSPPDFSRSRLPILANAIVVPLVAWSPGGIARCVSNPAPLENDAVTGCGAIVRAIGRSPVAFHAGNAAARSVALYDAAAIIAANRTSLRRTKPAIHRACPRMRRVALPNIVQLPTRLEITSLDVDKPTPPSSAPRTTRDPHRYRRRNSNVPARRQMPNAPAPASSRLSPPHRHPQHRSHDPHTSHGDISGAFRLSTRSR